MKRKLAHGTTWTIGGVVIVAAILTGFRSIVDGFRLTVPYFLIGLVAVSGLVVVLLAPDEYTAFLFESPAWIPFAGSVVVINLILFWWFVSNAAPAGAFRSVSVISEQGSVEVIALATGVLSGVVAFSSAETERRSRAKQFENETAQSNELSDTTFKQFEDYRADSDPVVRKRAYLALGRYSESNDAQNPDQDPDRVPEVCEYVLQGLDDESHEVRTVAANYVLRVATVAPACLAPQCESVVNALDTVEGEERVWLTFALAELSQHSPEVVEDYFKDIFQFHDDQNEAVRQNVLSATASLSHHVSEEVVERQDALIEHLNAESADIRESATNALLPLVKDEPAQFGKSIDALLETLDASVSNADVVSTILYRYVLMTDEGPHRIEDILEALKSDKDSDSQSLEILCRAIGFAAFRPDCDATDIGYSLKKHFNDTAIADEIVLKSFATLTEIDPATFEMIEPTVDKLITSGDSQQQSAALEILATASKPKPQTGLKRLETIEAFLRNGEPKTVQQVLYVLGGIAVQQPESVSEYLSEVQPYLSNEDEGLRQNAVWIYARVAREEPKHLWPVCDQLVDALSANRPELRGNAAMALANLLIADRPRLEEYCEVDEIISGIADGLHSATWFGRVEMLETVRALHEYEPGNVRNLSESVLSLCSFPIPRVATEACKTMGVIGEQSDHEDIENSIEETVWQEVEQAGHEALSEIDSC